MSCARIFHAILCVILFSSAAVLLGLTAYHVHFTETMFTGVSFYVPIVVELLVTSCLAIIVSLCAFIAIIIFRGSAAGLTGEAIMLGIICIMFLVGASIFSRGWHNISWCVGSQHVCRILSAIIAFSWINWVLTICLLFACIFHIIEIDEDRPAGHAARGNVQTTQTATTPVTNTAAEV